MSGALSGPGCDEEWVPGVSPPYGCREGRTGRAAGHFAGVQHSKKKGREGMRRRKSGPKKCHSPYMPPKRRILTSIKLEANQLAMSCGRSLYLIMSERGEDGVVTRRYQWGARCKKEGFPRGEGTKGDSKK